LCGDPFCHGAGFDYSIWPAMQVRNMEFVDSTPTITLLLPNARHKKIRPGEIVAGPFRFQQNSASVRWPNRGVVSGTCFWQTALQPFCCF